MFVSHSGPVLVITEYCCHGDLLNFLRNNAQTFSSYVVSIPEERGNYKNITAEKMFCRRYYYWENIHNAPLLYKLIICWTWHVCFDHFSDSGISSICSDAYLDMKPLVPRSQLARRNESINTLFFCKTCVSLIPWYFERVSKCIKVILVPVLV